MTGTARNSARRALASALLVAAAAACAAADDVIVDARYEQPVERYGHFALGRPHEYARLVARTSRGHEAVFELPDDEVFEDRVPRLVALEPGAAPALLGVVSSRRGGARLVLLTLRDGALAVHAQSPPIGAPNRWLNPVAVADLDADGRAEVAAVVTPHIGGQLVIYAIVGRRLEPIARADGFSNHLYGSAELELSLATFLDGERVLVVPGQTRRHLRVMALREGEIRERARCALRAAIDGPLREVEAGILEVAGRGGNERIRLTGCASR